MLLGNLLDFALTWYHFGCYSPSIPRSREVRGSRPIQGLVTSAAYTTRSALLFVVQVLIRSLLTYPKGYSIREVRGSRPIQGLVTSAAYTTRSALLFVVQTYPKGYSIREVWGSRPIPGLVTSAAYTTRSALLFVIQVLIRSLLKCRLVGAPRHHYPLLVNWDLFDISALIYKLLTF
ncbi:hypothetical protein LXL04_023665 [Taraxacum kok-saghyz]